MKVKYSPENQEPIEWDFNYKRIRSAEGLLIEQKFGGTFAAWQDAAIHGGMKARRILLWILLRRGNPGIRIEDVDPMFGELEVDLSVAELRDIRVALNDKRVRGEDEKAVKADALANLDALIESLEDDSEESDSLDPTTPTP